MLLKLWRLLRQEYVIDDLLARCNVLMVAKQTAETNAAIAGWCEDYRAEIAALEEKVVELETDRDTIKEELVTLVKSLTDSLGYADNVHEIPGHTCPLIDEVIRGISDAKSDCESAASADSLSDAQTDADQACDTLKWLDLEPIREANSELRDAAHLGQRLYNAVEEAIQEVTKYE